jgi:hypothetical protein
MHLSNWG